MKKYNICRVITRLPRGGIELRLAAILPKLQEFFNVRVAVIHERGEIADRIEASGIPVDLIKFKSRLSPAGLRMMRGYFEEHKIDLVHAHMYRSYIPATIAARRAKVPVMLGQIHNTDTWDTKRQKLLDRLLWRWRSGMLAVSQKVREDVCGTLGCPEEFVRLLYNGVEIERFKNAPVDLNIRREFGVGSGELLAVVVARLHSQKNHAMLLKAMKKVSANSPKLKLAIIGDGRIREELEQQAAELKLGDAVFFAGMRDDIDRIYRSADFSILPSDKEGFSNTVIESMAAGCPIIATDVGGNREAIIDGETGIITPPKDEVALIQAIEKLQTHSALRENMSAAGPLRAEVFSLDAMVEQTRELYLGFLKSGN